MIIYQPKIERKDDKSILSCEFTVKNEKKTLWFSYDTTYEEYLITESSDGFVVALLLLAMKLEEDIEIKGKMSARLIYQLNHYLIPALNLANNKWQKINISAETLTDTIYTNDSLVGTGVSGGVDSFATIYDHKNESSYNNIDFFTFFNVGSNGEYDSKKAKEVFNERVQLLKPYVESINKDFITVDSNLSDILMMDFQQSHTLRNIACVLNLQKLFNTYYYASAFRFDQYELTDKSMAYYDTLVLSMLSTETTTFYSSVSQFTRPERIELLSNYEPTYKYLNVCVKPSKDGKNCSKCWKCKRTLLTLDVIGKLNLYSSVFDLDKYYSYKEKYTGLVLADKNEDITFNAVYNIMQKYNYSISTKAYIYTYLYKVTKIIRK